MAKQNDAQPEDPSDWTELVQTRISPKAERLLSERLVKGSSMMKVSRAAWLRELIYKDLGLLPGKD